MNRSRIGRLAVLILALSAMAGCIVVPVRPVRARVVWDAEPVHAPHVVPR